MRGVNTRFWEMFINGLRELKISAGKPKVCRKNVQQTRSTEKGAHQVSTSDRNSGDICAMTTLQSVTLHGGIISPSLSS